MLPPGESVTLSILPISHAPNGPLWANMTSSIKPEVRNISQCRQKRTEPRPPLIRTESFAMFVRVVFETYERTDRQTYRQTDVQKHSSQYFAPLVGRSKMINLFLQTLLIYGMLYNRFFSGVTTSQLSIFLLRPLFSLWTHCQSLQGVTL